MTEEKKDSGRNQFLDNNMYAIVFTAYEDGKFAIQLNRPPKPVAGIETAMLIVFGLNRNDVGLKMWLKRTARKFMKYQHKIQQMQKAKAAEERAKLKDTDLN